jgi:hypothetical protein
MSDRICEGFEPQNYLRERCKKCFRLKSKHGTVFDPLQLPSTTTMPSVASPASSISGRSEQEKRRSWRDPHASDGVASPDYESKNLFKPIKLTF